MSAYRIDHQYDIDNASDGVSRYGAYIRQRRYMFTDALEDQSRTEFAAVAWQIARGPIMSPPYVRAHPQILDETICRSETGLVARVNLATGPPAELCFPTWRRAREWAGWPATAHGGHFYVPEADEVRQPYLLTTTTALIPMSCPDLRLPVEGDTRELLVAGAKSAVELLLEQLNEALIPLIGQIERGR